MAKHAADHAALDEEMAELGVLARGLAEFAPDLAPEIADCTSMLVQSRRAGGHPYAVEKQAESFARDLRRRCLQYAAVATSSVYRSPTQAQQARLAVTPRLETFGYERDLQPDTLEQRCVDFFLQPPSPWRADHVLFSSGQAAMTVALLALQQTVAARKLTIAHLGTYFETRALLDAQPALFERVTDQEASAADCLVIEPIACDGEFTRVDVLEVANQVAAAAASSRAVIFDSTLLGRADSVNRFLQRIDSATPLTVLRVCSGLKLFQAGLELANVGILSVFQVQGHGQDGDGLLDGLRRLRTLTGGGLRFADALALQAPWIFDPGITSKYEQSIFAHNAALAHAVAERNVLFDPISHPALAGADAPYCVFRLRQPSEDAYAALESWIAGEAQARQLLIDRGGSFGFRGHRFEVVRPESGEAPFLRVAMGRRGGWSCDGVADMIAELSRLACVPET